MFERRRRLCVREYFFFHFSCKLLALYSYHDNNNNRSFRTNEFPLHSCAAFDDGLMYAFACKRRSHSVFAMNRSQLAAEFVQA